MVPKKRENLICRHRQHQQRPSEAYCNPLTPTFSLGEMGLAHSGICGSCCSSLHTQR